MTLYKWSQTAALDATADSTINWAEGQAPSSINDSARAMMAATAKYRDDTSGSIAPGGTGAVSGTSSAYSVTSNQGFASLSALRLSEIVFVAPATNAVGVTLNVDGLGAQAINSADGVAIPAGTLIQGGVYRVTAYTGEFILHDFYGNPYNVPIAGFLPYAGATVPNSSFVFPFGQAISRTTYSALFSLVGSTYGAGDGSTTFNIPDLRGRGIFFKDNMGGSAANRITAAGSGIDAVNLSATGGAETHTLTQTEMPAHFHTAGISDPGHSHSTNAYQANTGTGGFLSSAGLVFTAGSVFAATTGIRISSGNGLDSTNTAGGGAAHPIMPPAYILNCIMRVI
jgi:microcystin-dependent protein